MNDREKQIIEKMQSCDKAYIQIPYAGDDNILNRARETYGTCYECNNGVAYFEIDAKRLQQIIGQGCPVCQGKLKPVTITYQEYLQDTDHYACPPAAFDIPGMRPDYRCSKCGHVIGIEFL